MHLRKCSQPDVAPRYDASSVGSAHPSFSMLCVHLDEVGEGVVDVGSFRQEKAAPRAHVIEEEQLLVLWENMQTGNL